ncbi:MAG: 3-oxoacyl-ACP reductase family protein [Nitriliruptorales bacterium]
MGDMSGQVALVTGGSRGIGRAICEQFIARGLRVAAGYSKSKDAAQEIVDQHPDAEVTIHQGNIANHEDSERVVNEVIEAHGRLDVLVNNAGMNIDKPVNKLSPDDWAKVIDVNLNGTFYISLNALPQMREQGYGRIINISSVIGEMGNVGQANYAAAKAGMFGLTYTLAKECAGEGITVNAVSPGFIDTDMVASIPDEMLENKILPQIPLGRLGQPEEVARVVEFLADVDSSYITGSVYQVNGGLYM